MWVTKLMISQVKKRIFCPKTTKFGPKLAFLVDMGQVMQVFSVPCWWVGWWLGPRGLYLARHLFTLFIQHLLGIFLCVLGSICVFSCFLLCSLLFSGMQATTQCGRRRVIRKRFKPRAPSNSLLYKGVPTLIYTSNSLLYTIDHFFSH